MVKKGLLVLFLFAFIFIFGIVSAQEDVDISDDASVDGGVDDVNGIDDGGGGNVVDGVAGDEVQEEGAVLEDLEEEFSDAEIIDHGLTPDSAFYFIDEFFDRFGDGLNTKEEKIAEIRAMIQEGNVEAARRALQHYQEYSERLEREVDPERIEDVKKSAAAIRRALRDIENEVSDDERQEFVDDIISSETSIITAVEIADKIKELCETLSGLDPLEYSRVCKSSDDAPRWHVELDEKLTKEQEEEAKKFAQIMSECFRTSGQQCRCEEIPFADFAAMCSVAAPLATACEIDGDEEACEDLENLEMPELPEHLQDVFDQLEGDISEAQFELHAPRECREAGVTSPEECMKIMIRTHAPPECVEELERANVQNERKAREICERIMFELNAPEECVEQGLKNPKECGKLMFRLNAPEECIEAGLTGENRGDEKKCRLIMESQGRGPDGRGPPALGVRCRNIENSEERLKCYDEALSGAHDYKQGHRDSYKDYEQRRGETEEYVKSFAKGCREKGGRWDCSFSDVDSSNPCRCFVDEHEEEFGREFEEKQGEFEGGFEERFGEGEEFDEGRFREGFGQEFGGEFREGPRGSFDSGDSQVSGEGGSESFSSSPSGESSSTSGSEGGFGGGESGGVITGGVITGRVIGGNKFLEYLFG